MPEARLSHNEIPAGLNITKRYETSHTETWDITFTATVPAGLEGLNTTAREIVVQRMTQILLAAGVHNPNVRARKLARSPHRGTWEPGVEYEPGEIVDWHETSYTATAPSCNRPPHTHTSGYRKCWEEGEPFQVDVIFDVAEPLVEPVGELEPPSEDNIVDAEIVEEE